MARPKSKRALIASALLVQVVVLGGGWFLTFRIVQRSFGLVVEDIVQEHNREIVERVASLLPSVMDDVEFGGDDWEKLQRVIEGEALNDLPAGGFACLIEPDGRLLCHPDIRDDPGLRNFSFSGMQIAESLDPEAEYQPVISAGSPNEPASGILEFPGEFHYVATQPIDSNGLRLLVHQPVSGLIKTGESSTQWILIIAGFASIGVLSISGFGLNMLLHRYEGAQERLNHQLKEHLLVARRIQRATLPSSLPKVAGYAFSGWSEPADETGGDTFDFVELGGGREVAIMIADASGHGIGPALAIAQLQAMAHLSWRHERDPLAVARVLNERMVAQLPDGRFVTAWFGVLDHTTGRLRMISSGQDPQLVYRAATDRVERLPTDTVPLGILDGLEGDGCREIELEPGDTLLLASDGIAETALNGEQFGVERLAKVLHSNNARTPEEITDAVRLAVSEFSRDRQAADDRTVVVVQRERTTMLAGESERILPASGA
ncbi:MAG: SpoIIE family protein phosphatase [Phycisphaera sp.]|nr:MAG: SpoIIE family protein phosphatase [Phycisphaera sp.]